MIYELKRLKTEFPLFEFKSEQDGIRARLSNGFSIHFKQAGPEIYERLCREHCTASLKAKFMEQYPHLYFGVSISNGGIHLTLWRRTTDQNGNPRDGEGIEPSLFEITDPTLHTQLAELNSQAANPNLFFCYGHRKFEHRSNYGFFHFAGLYCRTYGIEHPDVLQRAKDESYN